MTTLLNALMTETTMDETLKSGAKQIKSVGISSGARSFRVTAKDGFITTELYPNSRTIDSNTRRHTLLRAK